MQKRVIVVKIGPGTLSEHDTTPEHLVELQKQGKSLVVVHGDDATSEWLRRLSIPTAFAEGPRSTDVETLKVAAALVGLVNKELVVAIQALGGKAMGLSGCDGNLLWATVRSPGLGYLGEIVAVDPAAAKLVLKAGYMPVVAPISFGSVEGSVTLLSVNGDAAAGEIAAALDAEKLIFFTDADGIYNPAGQVVARLNAGQARGMLSCAAANGGTTSKIEAGLRALTTTKFVRIIDTRAAHGPLQDINERAPQLAKRGGTTIVTE